MLKKTVYIFVSTIYNTVLCEASKDSRASYTWTCNHKQAKTFESPANAYAFMVEKTSSKEKLIWNLANSELKCLEIEIQGIFTCFYYDENGAKFQLIQDVNSNDHTIIAFSYFNPSTDKAYTWASRKQIYRALTSPNFDESDEFLNNTDLIIKEVEA